MVKYLYGLTFRGRHSYKDFGLIMRSIDRSVLPSVKKQTVDIPFLDGEIDLRDEPIYNNRDITVSLAFLDLSVEALQKKKREAAGWLSGRGFLKFDDEPDKYYDAKVFGAIGLEQVKGRMAFQVVFNCQPFALKSPTYLPLYITKQNQVINIDVEGTIKTCAKITLTNEGTTTLDMIKLLRERSKA